MTPTRITKRELDEMLAVEFDWEARTAFVKMSREEQLMAVLSAQAYLRGEIAVIKKRQLEFEDDLVIYRRKREEKEKDNDDSNDLKNVTQKIIAEVKKELSARFDIWVWLRDKVAPQFVSVLLTIFIILMGLFLSGNFPW